MVIVNSCRNDLNRKLSALQVDIIRYLAAIEPAGGADEYGQRYVGHWPLSGRIAAAVGKGTGNSALASVSRSLKRLINMGLVEAAACPFIRGFRYGLTAAGRDLAALLPELA